MFVELELHYKGDGIPEDLGLQCLNCCSIRVGFFPFGNLLFILNRFQRSLGFSGRSHEFKNKLKYTSYVLI